MSIESLRFPLDRRMRIVFTGYFNGFNVEVRSPEEVALLYHMGCFGKGSASRSRPNVAQNPRQPSIMRKRQFQKRNFWYKKFQVDNDKVEPDYLLKEIDELTTKIVRDSENLNKRDVIDLVSSDEEHNDCEDLDSINVPEFPLVNNMYDTAVIVPNSDSEEENYFENIQPKCCINKINIQEKLILSLEEAYFLLYGLGCLHIVKDDIFLNIEQCWELFSTTSRNFVSKYVVYHYYRSKGYVVKSAIKYGGDYLLYKESPEVAHGHYIIVIKSKHHKDDWLSVLGHIRMAQTAVKNIMMVEVIEPKDAVKLPEGLGSFSVQEVLFTNKIPEIINKDD